MDESWPEISFEAKAVLPALKSFEADAAPGPSGLKAEHLRDCCTCSSSGTCESLTKALARFAHALLNGQFPETFGEFLLSGTLLPFKKPDGGVRPIVVGEVLRQLTAKLAMAQLKSSIPKVLLPLQCGVAVKDAVSMVAHTLRLSVRAAAIDQKLGALQIDISNAFNEVSRSAILSFVVEHFPLLARWTRWSLCQRGKLVNGETTIWSERGVQQGDPLAPMLFACGIQRILLRLRERHPSLLSLWYWTMVI